MRLIGMNASFSQRGLEEVQEITYLFPYQGSDFLFFRTLAATG